VCGLVGARGPVPAADWRRALAGAAARGPHSYGWGRLQDDGTWAVQYGAGSLTGRPPPPAGTVLIGHSRLATSTARPGDLPDPAEGQPLTSADGASALAHNGAATNPALLAHASRMPRDSSALLELLLGGLETLREHGALLDGAPHALILAHDGCLAVWRRPGPRRDAHPLYLTRYPQDGWLVAQKGAASDLLGHGLTVLERQKAPARRSGPGHVGAAL